MGPLDGWEPRPEDAAGEAVGGDPTYRCVFGHYLQKQSWLDVRTVLWPDLASLLITHEVGPKEGTCIVPAVFRGNKRHKADADQIDVAFLDSDTGHTLEEIKAAIAARGWKAIISSSHSHQTTRTQAKRGNWDKFLAHCGDQDGAAAAFLEAKGYQPEVTVDAQVVEETDEHVVFSHQPCPKFRVILPLQRPWLARNYDNQRDANAAWKERVEALASSLGLSHDQSCTDTSRLFYLPRRPADGPPAETAVLEGTLCDIFVLPLAPKIETERPTPGRQAGATEGRHRVPPGGGSDNSHVFTNPATGEEVNLRNWAKRGAQTFELRTALQRRRPDLFVHVVSDGGKHHIRCVNDGEHTQGGADTATFVVNASESTSIGFAYHCRHAHCDGRDRLFFLRQMLEEGWLTLADLTDPAFSATTGDGEQPPPSFDDCCTAAAALSADSSPDDITSVLRLVAGGALDAIPLRRVLDVLKKKTGLPLADLKAGLREIERENRGPSADVALEVATNALDRFWQEGRHLIRAIDKSFWGYTGTHWRRWTDEQIKSRLLDVIKDIVDPDERDFNSALNASFNLLIASSAISTDVLRLAEEPPPVINCANGELWIAADASVQLKPHRHDSYLTYVLDVAYDPSATCPEFDRTVEEIFARSSDAPEMARHYLEFMGYALQPRRDIACYFMMKGHGSNGKTKLMETIEKLTNARCIFSGRLAEIEENRFLIGSLAGKLILLDDDIDTGTRLPDGLLKKLSERKLLTGELKFKDSFEFVATCLPVLLANNFPLCADLSYGQRRRAHIIPFDRVFSTQEDDRGRFPRIWQHELPGILNRAIEGLQRLRRRGGFQEPVDCISAKEEWLAHANPLVAFIEEGCCVNASGQLPLSDFYSAFTQWATSAGIKTIPARNTLRANLVNLGYTVRHTKHYSSVVFGIELARFYPASVCAAAG